MITLLATDPLWCEESEWYRFVLKEHHATRLHFDLRLEWNGVAVSWAVPKGISMNPAVTRLAVSVPDHPLRSLDFEGTRRRGLYGAGEVVTWDKGEYQTFPIINSASFGLILFGRKLRGKFLMSKSFGDNNDWFITKVDDEYSDPNFEVECILNPRKHRGFEPLFENL
jgi:bifunctional non-homologous end joining protein LigD